MTIANLTPKQLRQAASIQEKIAALEKQLATICDPGSGIPAPFLASKSAKPAKRKLSASHLAKIRAAQKLRWAKVKAAKAKIAPKPVKKGGMSAAGRAKVAAAQKARWAKIKGAKTATKAPVKPVAVKAAVKPATKAVKRVISPEARAKMAAAAKAMWVARKAAKK